MLKHYVTFLYPGSLFPNESQVEIKSREEKVEFPKGAFAYTFFDREEVEQDGEILYGKSKNKSARFYKGEVFDLQQVEALYPEHKILISNMKINGYKQVVKTIAGNFQPICEGDVVFAP